jgi:hypothetical protein
MPVANSGVVPGANRDDLEERRPFVAVPVDSAGRRAPRRRATRPPSGGGGADTAGDDADDDAGPVSRFQSDAIGTTAQVGRGGSAGSL